MQARRDCARDSGFWMRNCLLDRTRRSTLATLDLILAAMRWWHAAAVMVYENSSSAGQSKHATRSLALPASAAVPGLFRRGLESCGLRNQEAPTVSSTAQPYERPRARNKLSR